MPKEIKQPKLRPVDENPAEKVSRLVRLDKDKIEELDEHQTAVRVGLSDDPEVRLEGSKREDLKLRSQQPSLDDLADHEIVTYEEDWGTQKTLKRFPWGWFWLVGMVVAFALGWSMWDIFQTKQRKEVIQVGLSQEAMEEVAELEARQTVESIKQVTMGFYASQTIDDLMNYVRHPERMRPLMEDYYSRQPMHSPHVVSIKNLSPLTISGRGGFWIVTSYLESGEESIVLVEVSGTEDAKVDWETYVCYQPIDWDRLVTESPSGYTGDFRVNVEVDHFYNYEFSDSEKYQCYKLTERNSHEMLFGYVLRGGYEHEKIEAKLKASKEDKTPMILRLYMPEGAASKRGVLIVEIISPYWLLLD